MNDNLSRVIEVDINEILPNRFQPRIQFDEDEILELSDSIKEHGVIQPIVVRTIGDKYEIIAGERRYKASVLAGKETVPVIVKNLNDKESAEVALIENIQRKNLTPIEEALSYKKILDMGYITQDNLADKLGKSQSSIANKIRLLNLSDEVQEALLENKISERHARSLLKLTTSYQQNIMLNKIISERLTVRRADEEIEKMKNQPIEEVQEGLNNIKEKEEINMDNNLTNMTNINTQPQGFDIFSSPMPAPVQEVPTVEPQPQVSQMGGIQFDANGMVTSMPNQIVPEVPTVEPQPQVSQIGGIQFDANGMVTSMPTQTVQEAPTIELQPQVSQMGGIQFDANGMVTSMPTQTVQEAPTIESQPQVSQMGGIQFDANGMVTSMPTQTVQEVPTVEPQPQTPTVEPISIPETAPIIEEIPAVNPVEDTKTNTLTNDLFSFGPAPSLSEPVNPESNNLEFKLPEPIIVTDYSKQYDPVMPQTVETTSPVVDFKEVINIIRECSSKIEQYGYKIDVEEYDLANLYQVVFKIEK